MKIVFHIDRHAVSISQKLQEIKQEREFKNYSKYGTMKCSLPASNNSYRNPTSVASLSFLVKLVVRQVVLRVL